MSDLKFADTFNLVAFLSKPAESEGFEQIVDFLNATPINYALTVNLTIYTSCIEQFWAIVKAKTINGKVQLQALVDGKKIVITEEIFNYKMLKIFGNMKREGKGFSRRVTPLFPTMMVQAQEEMGEGSVILTDPHHTPTIIESSSQPQKKHKPRKPKRKDTEVPQPSSPTTNVADKVVNKENVSKHSNDPLLSSQDSLKLKELMALRVKRLEKKKRSRTHRLKRLYKVGLSRRVESSEDEGLGKEDASKQGRIADIDAAKDIYLVNDQRDEDMFGVNDLDGDEVVVETKVAHEVDVKIAKETVTAAATTVSAAIIAEVDITLAQALSELKSTKPKATTTTVATTPTSVSTRPKAKGLVIHEQEQATTPTVSSQQSS
ncbi:hypothetical protein Tco_0525992 [Tanacetum coccineum]